MTADRSRRLWAWQPIWLPAILLAGCAAPPWSPLTSGDLSVQRASRAEVVREDFEQRRDQALALAQVHDQEASRRSDVTLAHHQLLTPSDRTPPGETSLALPGADGLEGSAMDKQAGIAEWADGDDKGGPESALAAAIAALERNEARTAATIVHAALGRFPDSASLHRTLGLACYRQGDYAAARSALEKAITLDKASALSYFLMGATLRKLGDGEAAARHFRRAAVLDPRFDHRR